MNYTARVHLGLGLWAKRLVREIYHKEMWYCRQSANNKNNINLALKWIKQQRSGYRYYKRGKKIIRKNNLTNKAYYSVSVQAGFNKILARIMKIMQNATRFYVLSDNRDVLYASYCFLRSKYEKYGLENYAITKHKHQVKFNKNKSAVTKLLERVNG